MFSANGVLAVAQTSISSVYLPISLTFDEQITGLGVLSSVYFLAVAVTEVPGGLFSSSLGPKRITLIGSTIASLAILATTFAPSFAVLVVLRVVVGAGLGLATPSMLVLTMRSLGKGASGRGVALFSIASSLGAAVGFPAWSILAADYGWRTSLFVDGAFTGAVTLVVLFMVPFDEGSSTQRRMGFELRTILRDRRIQVLSLAFFGTGITVVLIGNFMVYYLETVLSLQPGYAGAITGLGALTPISSYLLFGRFYDRGVSARATVFGATVGLGIGTALVSIHSLIAAIVGIVVCGVSGPPISIAVFSISRRLAPRPDLEALTIGFVDAVSLVGVFAGALLFPLFVVALGYPLAWILGGAACIVLTAPVLAFKNL
ncbi:MAG: MFS transporter [Thaumarchaeota archaeon]|nr:MFS transporter [Nitrososphaerota archaeon]